MDNFYKLRADKQEHIINAALVSFGRNGYKKASFADIAEGAGIAKGMVSYYFGCKRSLYLYLAELCGSLFTEEIEKHFDTTVTDFFDRIKMASDTKIAVMKRYPAAVDFLASLYNEEDPDVIDDVRVYIKNSARVRKKWMTDNADVSRFKDGIDPKLLEKFLVWAGEGFAKDLSRGESMDNILDFIGDFYACLAIMKKHFYKEEQ
jgi:AcrR family transcriptional regulator